MWEQLEEAFAGEKINLNYSFWRKDKIMSNNNSTGGGIGFAGLLTILFIGLKLTGYISWSWWWVLSPIWITVVAVIGIFLMIFVVWIIAELLKSNRHKKNRRIP